MPTYGDGEPFHPIHVLSKQNNRTFLKNLNNP